VIYSMSDIKSMLLSDPVSCVLYSVMIVLHVYIVNARNGGEGSLIKAVQIKVYIKYIVPRSYSSTFESITGSKLSH